MIFRDATAKAAAGMAKLFEEDRGRILFRGRPTAIPVVVTAAERDEEIANFSRAVTRLSWCFLAAIIIGCVLLVAAEQLLDRENPLDVWALMAVAFLGFLALYWRAWTHPRRRFLGRSIAGPAFDRSQARARTLAKTSWRDLWMSAGTLAVLIGSQAMRHDVLHGWGRLWIVAGVAAFLVIAWRMAQKIKMDRHSN